MALRFFGEAVWSEEPVSTSISNQASLQFLPDGVVGWLALPEPACEVGGCQ